MANIFRKKDAYIDRVNRSTFDLSFVNNLTMKFGAITPVCLLHTSGRECKQGHHVQEVRPVFEYMYTYACSKHELLLVS